MKRVVCGPPPNLVFVSPVSTEETTSTATKKPTNRKQFGVGAFSSAAPKLKQSAHYSERAEFQENLKEKKNLKTYLFPEN